jgi:hypothetical protein
MATAAQEYRNQAATCLLLSKTMDEDNKQRLEDIARQWLELAEQEEQGDERYLEAEGNVAGVRRRHHRTAPEALSLTSGVAIGS